LRARWVTLRETAGGGRVHVQGSAQLAARVAGLVTGGVCKGRDTPSGAAAVDVAAVTRSLAKAASLASRCATKVQRLGPKSSRNRNGRGVI
jgi:hypothetical protein